MTGKLYLVGTPIGNLGDITYRAVETLKSVDIIACEDTRHSAVLLNHLGIKKPKMSYHQHKEQEVGERLVGLLLEGKNIALITDAGMPCISDPGAVVVAKAREAGVEVSVVPGATALASAIALSGISPKPFTFFGFLPPKNKDRLTLLEGYKRLDSTLIFYSSPHDINDDIKFLHSVFGERKVQAVKEITKMFEGVTFGMLSSFEIENPRGEFVLLIEGFDKESEILENSASEQLQKLLNDGVDKKTAIKQVAKERGVCKDEIYKLTIKK